MRRTVVALFAALAAAGSVCAEITVSGEVRTGLYMEQEKIGDEDPVADGGMTNTDGYSGSGQGLMRMNFDYAYENVGLRASFQIEPRDETHFIPTWNHAYAYGNLFNDQFTVSAGLLGDSPWGATGGTELNRNLETREYWKTNILSGDPYVVTEALIGIRFEFKPAFLPILKGLNVGFTLNQPDQTNRTVVDRKFGDMLGESVVGIAYEHEYFAVSVGYRFDGKADSYTIGDSNGDLLEEGGRLAYRVEERILGTFVDGMKVWLNGYYFGIGCGQTEIPFRINGKLNMVEGGPGEYWDNWLYWLWDTDSFIAQFDTRFAMYKTYINSGFEPIKSRLEYQSLEFRPAFYYKFFNNLLQAGVRLGLGMEFGEGKTYKDSQYQYIFVEPQIRLNLSGNAYIAAVYNYTDKYVWNDEEEKRGEKSAKYSLNIRAVYTF